jgi:hypothetical protein
MFTTLLRGFGLKWYEGIFIGVFILLTVFAYLQYKRLDRTQEQLTRSEVNLQTTTGVLVYREASQAITNRTVGEFIDEQLAQLRQQSRRRQEFTHEYLKLVQTQQNTTTPTPEPAPEPMPDVVEPVPVPTSTVVAKPQPKPRQEPVATVVKPGEGNDLARLQLIAGSLRDSYCAATAPAQVGRCGSRTGP